MNTNFLKVSRPARELIRRLLQKNPKDRPSVDEVFDHPWMRHPYTIDRVNRLYEIDATLLCGNETSLELTLVNVSLSDPEPQPPQKKRRIE